MLRNVVQNEFFELLTPTLRLHHPRQFVQRCNPRFVIVAGRFDKAIDVLLHGNKAVDIFKAYVLRKGLDALIKKTHR